MFWVLVDGSLVRYISMFVSIIKRVLHFWHQYLGDGNELHDDEIVCMVNRLVNP